MSDDKKIIVNGEEVSDEEFQKLQEDANKGKIKLKKEDENQYKKLDKLLG